MKLTVLSEKLSVLKLNPALSLPTWVYENKQFLSITYTEEELSIVCKESTIPENIDATIENGWSCIKVVGELDFSLTGVLANLANTLATAKVSIFALSTYNTDYLLVKTEKLQHAIKALETAGYEIV
ncbi:ACT domain-containing protein [Aquibacillus rhizosphaerae]|uniref:ACT domain-containing protein n=1 Tax=Aquibacillus rhizosphaerae TaxID=3051431 RepID=A0ABT7LD90_9BACI|nr:ACT domain-containing protein [Aquibacillus sp. LR5S19]MDL4842560.1 ACT domain-containing protein [Aquibacillus sp. LR5S19]